MNHRVMAQRSLVPMAMLAILGLSGCASAAGDSSVPATTGSAAVSRPTAEPDADAAALLPAEVADSGKLRVVTTIGMAPLNYPDPATGDLAGFNIDIMEQIGEVLGLEVETVGATMDQIIPGMQAKRYDVTASNMAITEERKAALDFIEYYFASSSIATAAGNPDKVSGAALCGLAVGVGNGSFQQTSLMPKKSEACEGEGAKALDVQSFPDQQNAIQALASGRLDTVAGDSATLLYAAAHDPRVAVAEKITDGSIVGIGVPDGSPLAEAISAALNKLMTGGQYAKTLEMYGISDLGIDDAAIKR